MDIKDHYDVVIVGAGVGGGALARSLAASGCSILMIERGPRLAREPDNWSVAAVFHQRKYAAKEQWRDRDGNLFAPGTYYYVGGNSKFFGAATVRFRAQDFEDLAHEGGVAPAWPVRYGDFEPYYAEAERLMGTHGTAGADPIEPPRSGPMPHPAIGHEPEIAEFERKLRARGLHPFPLPIAIDYHAGGTCLRCRTCDGFACQIGAKGDAEVRLVDPALASGNVTLITETYVRRFVTDPSGRRVTGVEIEQASDTGDGRRQIAPVDESERGGDVVAGETDRDAAVPVRERERPFVGLAVERLDPGDRTSPEEVEELLAGERAAHRQPDRHRAGRRDR